MTGLSTEYVLDCPGPTPTEQKMMEFIFQETAKLANRFTEPPPGLKWQISHTIDSSDPKKHVITYAGVLVPIVQTCED